MVVPPVNSAPVNEPKNLAESGAKVPRMAPMSRGISIMPPGTFSMVALMGTDMLQPHCCWGRGVERAARSMIKIINSPARLAQPLMRRMRIERVGSPAEASRATAFPVLHGAARLSQPTGVDG